MLSNQIKIFRVLLATVFAVTSIPHITALADERTDAEIESLLEYEQTVQSLRDHFSAESDNQLPQFGNTQHPLDQFHILRQVVVDQRQEDMNEKVDALQEDHQKEILEHRLSQIKNAQHLTEAERAELTESVTELYNSKPESLEDFVDRDLKPRKFYGQGLTFDIIDSNGVSVHQVHEKDFRGSFTSRFSSYNKSFNSKPRGEETYQFLIRDKKGEKIAEFEVPIKNMTLWGNYLVFAEENTYDAATETMPLRFIDLEYFRGDIGNAPLPVFTLPVHSTQELDTLRVHKGELDLGDIKVSREYMDLVSNAHKAIYNIQVSLVDPKTLSKNENLIRELAYYTDVMVSAGGDVVKGQMEHVSGSQDKLRDLVSQAEKVLEAQGQVGTVDVHEKIVKELQAATDSSGEEGTADPEERDPMVESAMQSFEKDRNFQKGIKKTNHHIQISRKLLSRLNLLISRIMSPQPQGSAKILQSLVILAEGGLKFDWSKLKEGASAIKNHPYLRYLSYGSTATAAAFLSQSLPEPFAVNLADILEMGKAGLEHVHGYFKNANYGQGYLQVTAEAAANTAQGVGMLDEAYVGAEKTPKLLVGVGMLLSFVGAMFGSLHLTANTFDVYKNIKVYWAKAREEGLGRMKSFVRAFTDYQKQKRQDFDVAAAKADQEISGGSGDLTETQMKDLEFHMDQIREENSNSLTTRMWGAVKSVVRSPVKVVTNTLSFWKRSANELAMLTDEGEESSVASERLSGDISKNTKNFKSVSNFPKALKQFFFSYPSLLSTYKFVGKIWNYGFIGRSFALRPKLWYMMLTYPKFFRTTISAGKGAAQVPSAFNGGLRRTWQTGRFWANKQVNGSYLNSDTEALQEIKKWEKKILPVEQAVTEVALKKSVSALIHYVDDPEKLSDLFDSGQLGKMGLTNSQIKAGASPSTGINNLVDKKVKKILNNRETTFFRAYFHKAFEETMTQYLGNVARENGDEIENIEHLTPQELKIATLKHSESFKAEEIVPGTSSNLQGFADDIMTELEKDGDIHFWADNVATTVAKLRKRLAINYRYDTMKALNPAGPQMDRFLTFEEKVQKTSAALRAMRSELAGLVVNVPMGILSKFVIFAGITEGILMPLQEQFFGPNSFFYLSRYLFYNGMLYGLFISFMADFWMKLQVDARIDDEGNFDRLPSVKDRKKSFWRYYFKSLKNPTNKWWQNHYHLIKLITANIPAAFVTFLVGQKLFLGRFDIGIFLAGYAMVYLTPLSGINYKLEQGFELASNWVKGQVPRDLLGSPEAAKFINGQIQKKKFSFNFFLQIYEILMGSVLTKVQLMSTEEFGPRSFLRLMFNGYTPTELLANGLRTVGEWGAEIPGVQKAMESCESFFTNNYTDWQKAPSTEEFYGQ